MLVDRTVKLRLDLVKAVHHRMPLLLREVQRLARIVREEGIVADLLSERRTAYQIGMEQHPMGAWMHAGAHPARSNLPGSKAHNRTLLIVVGLAAVDDVTASSILKV